MKDEGFPVMMLALAALVVTTVMGLAISNTVTPAQDIATMDSGHGQKPTIPPFKYTTSKGR